MIIQFKARQSPISTEDYLKNSIQYQSYITESYMNSFVERPDKPFFNHTKLFAPL